MQDVFYADAQTYSYMQSAGFTETRSHPPIQNLAKAPKLRLQAEHPHFVYSLLGADKLLEELPHMFKNSMEFIGQFKYSHIFF